MTGYAEACWNFNNGVQPKPLPAFQRRLDGRPQVSSRDETGCVLKSSGRFEELDPISPFIFEGNPLMSHEPPIDLMVPIEGDFTS